MEKRKLIIPVEGASTNTLEARTAMVVSELMNAATSIHKLHLKVTGPGSFASHSALNEFYDALPEHADTLAEGFQGAHEKLLEYGEESSPKILNSVEDGLSYLRELKTMINDLQLVMPYSEIGNDLDNVKSTINSIKYKLLFLQ